VTSEAAFYMDKSRFAFITLEREISSFPGK